MTDTTASSAPSDWIHAGDVDAAAGNPGLHPALAESADALPDDYRRDLLAFIHALVDQRGFPQHLAVIFNALRYGYDLSAGGYHLPLFSDGVYTDIWAAETCDAVPVGAFVRVMTRRDVGDIPAEVVYKEGRHPDVSAEHVPDDMPGRMADPDDTGRLLVREALVVDRRAFVDHSSPTAAEFDAAVDRIRRSAHRSADPDLDARGHYVGQMEYRSVDDAEMSDVDYFTRWLARREGSQLLAELIDTTDVGTARTALQQILRSLRTLCDDDPDLYLWRGYVYSKARYDARTDDHSGDSVYGAAELGRLWRSISSPPNVPVGAGAPDRVALHPLTDRLLELCGCAVDTPADDIDDVVAAHIDETGWVSTVVHAQVFLTREADVDATDDGVVKTTLRRDGVAVHARVDDAWQHGAIWRTERFDWPLQQPAPTLLSRPAAEPLGLGAAPWEDDQPLADVDEQVADEPADELIPADDDDFLRTSYDTWTVRLGHTRLTNGWLPVPADICADWRPGQTMTVRLDHFGRTTHSVTFDAAHRLLVGLDWPASMPVAAKVRCQVAARVGTLVITETKPLDEPYWIEEGGVPMHVAVEVDEAMLRRFLADAPAGTSGHGSSRSVRSSRPGIADALVRLLAVAGDDSVAGGKRMDLDTLTRQMFPDVEPTPRLRSLVLRAASQAGISVAGGAIEWQPGVGAGVDVDIDLSQLAAAGDERAQQVRAAMRAHPVRMHLRELTVSEVASPQRRRDYPRVRAEAGAHHLPPQLPDGYSYVTGG